MSADQLVRVRLPTATDTADLGRRLATILRRGDLVVLAGPLGAGKTVVVKGIGAGLDVRGAVVSPTFVIARVHRPASPGGIALVHVDAYRLGSLAEVDDLDLDVDVTDAVTAVEWGEGLVEQLTDAHLTITLDRDDSADVRHATLHAHGGDWAARLAELGLSVDVLVVDTSTPAVTAGIVRISGGAPELVAVRAPHDARGHGELLAPSVAAALAEAGVTAAEVDAVVAGLGPGPFTGLRVGLVTAAVFADVRAIPVYGVCSLDGVGAAVPEEAELLVLTDARRREVYWARYRYGVRVGEPDVSRPADVPLEGVTAVGGPGAELYAEHWPDLPRHLFHPDPVALAAVAADRLRSGAPSEALTPLYLRRPDATVPGTPKPVTR